MEKITIETIITMADSDISLIEWVMQLGLIGDRYICSKCGDEMILTKISANGGYVWRCHKFGENGHDVKRSIRKGSWFEESKLSMKDILLVTHMWCLKMSNEAIMEELGLSSRTVTNWKQLCREICVEMFIRENEMLGGPGVIVEMDESKFGKRKFNKGQYINGKWVFGGIERGTDKCFMLVVEERNKNVLLEIIKKYIKPGTTIISRFWKSYNCLEDEGFRNLINTHSVDFKDAENLTDTSSIEGTWAAVKRSFTGNHVVGEFNSYLFEYMWRRKHQNKNITAKFINAVKELYIPQTADPQPE